MTIACSLSRPTPTTRVNTSPNPPIKASVNRRDRPRPVVRAAAATTTPATHPHSSRAAVARGGNAAPSRVRCGESDESGSANGFVDGTTSQALDTTANTRLTSPARAGINRPRGTGWGDPAAVLGSRERTVAMAVPL